MPGCMATAAIASSYRRWSPRGIGARRFSMCGENFVDAAAARSPLPLPWQLHTGQKIEPISFEYRAREASAGTAAIRGACKLEVQMKTQATSRLVRVGRVSALTKSIVVLPPTEAGSLFLGEPTA